MGKKNVHFGSLNCTVKRGLWISDDLKAPVCPDLPLFPGPPECGQCERLLHCSWPVVAIGCCMAPPGSSCISRLHCICSYVVAILAPLWKCVCWCLSTPGRSQGRVSHRSSQLLLYLFRTRSLCERGLGWAMSLFPLSEYVGGRKGKDPVPLVFSTWPCNFWLSS